MASHSGPVVELAPGTRALGRSMGPAKTSSAPISAFLGLPFAEPPVGPLRFQPPKSVELWTGDRDATKHGAVCPQDMSVWEKLPGKVKLKVPTNVSEDCLYLNVWTQTGSYKAKKAVMVFIHGGGFLSGYSDFYYGTAMVGLGDVVLVTINYRLNVFGFMTTGDDVCPGNYGILDQIEALRWVKKNIAAFGGDPDNVTIFGESAGSVSVAALLQTSHSKGLFKRAICQSGTTHAPWAYAKSASAFKTNKSYLEALGCSSTNSEEVISFLRNLPADDLVKPVTPLCLFSPVIDEEVFKTEDIHADVNVHHPDADAIIGINSHEGCMFAYAMANFTAPDNDTVAKILSGMMTPNFGERAEAAAGAIIEQYMEDSMTDDERLKKFIKLLGDYFFGFSSLKTTEVQARGRGKTYMYLYQYREPISEYPDWVEADHGADLMVVFGHRLMKDEIIEQLVGFEGIEDSAESEEVSLKVITLWTNFAKTGNPSTEGQPEWPQYSLDTREHIVIDTTFSTGQNLMVKESPFWKSFVDKFPTSR